MNFIQYIISEPVNVKEFIRKKGSILISAIFFNDQVLAHAIGEVQMNEWHEDQEFWDVLGPVMFNRERWDQAASDIPKIEKLLRLKKGARILDLACGNGRYAIPLAKKGYRVTAVDPVVSYIEQARHRAGKENISVDFMLGDMREFNRSEGFDAVLIMGNSFGIFKEEKEEKLVLENLFRSVVRGGCVLIENPGKEIVKKNYQKTVVHESEWIRCEESHTMRNEWGWMDSSVTVYKDGQKGEFTYSYRLHNAEDMVDLLTAAGFTEVRVFGDLSGGTYNEDAEKLVTVARK